MSEWVHPFWDPAVLAVINAEYPTKSGIYAIRCLANGKVYIGSSVDMGDRWSVHKCLLSRSKHRNHRLQRAWNEYGSEKFVFEVLVYVYNLNLLGEVEDEYITKYKSSNLRFGFNSRLAGWRCSEETRKRMSEASRGRKHSEETKIKMSEERRGKPQMGLRGKKKSEEHRQKLREANLGKKASEETRRKMSETRTGKLRGPMMEEQKQKLSEAHHGKKLSEEHKQKLVEANLGKKRSEETRKKIAESNRGKKHSEETKKKIKESSRRINRSGEKNNSAKTSWLEVREIREKYATGEYTQVSLAWEYGLSKGTIYNIIHNLIWIKDEVLQ